MKRFYLKAMIYMISFILSLFSLSAIDFNRFIRQGKVYQAQFLYVIISVSLAYLFGSFVISLIYYFAM